MRVLIDAHMVGSRETGNETYVTSLATALAKMPDINCAAAISPHIGPPPQFATSSLELLRLGSSNDLFRLSFGLAQLCRRWKAEILHVTYVAPIFAPCPIVVSVHDVSFKRYPNFFSRRDRLLFRTLLPYSMKQAAAILTISEHARTEIEYFYPEFSGKVYVTPLAPSPSYGQANLATELKPVQKKYEIDERFVLAVGNLQPRKNLLRLLKAFSTVRQSISNIQLVIAGKEDWQSSDIYDYVKAHDLEDAVIFTGYVPEGDLKLLYGAADIFVYPSVYEGFGLPILEAMACGTPVITSNTASMPEVAGEAALLVDPLAENEIAQALLDLLSNAQLAKHYAKAGQERARTYSWHHTATQTVSTYMRALNGHN